ncbi:uncharacterized protein LOC114534632 [Dendronephthya gigantea]|uniref:uncharacterized protein LOC114534632 n=1 Tax=Dendronephthya gigantea TaxID=151771 RepID=UPI00106D3761|nr:uncharacterized protein LOC114534632 [Dendronephthya gigantea]
MKLWLVLLAFVHCGLAIGLYDEIDDSRIWRRGGPSVSKGPDKECIRDILVIWDNSQSVGIGNFMDNVRPFLRDLIDDPKLNVGNEGTHIGFITFASDDKTRELLKIGSKTSKSDLKTWLNGLDYRKDLMGPFTYTGKAFKLASDEFHLKNPLNHRADIQDVVLLFTDGEPRARKKAWIREQYAMANRYSAELMGNGIYITALAVGREAKKPEFKRNIDKWSNHMFIAAFKDLDKVLDKIVKKSCGIKPLACSCDGKVSTEQYTKPGENSISLRWKEPQLKCDKPVDQRKTVHPADTRNPQRFGVGTHEITYRFTYTDSTGKTVSQDCFFEVKVGACECPSSQTVSARVKIGETKASVSWSEPVPTCPRVTASPSNPRRAGGQFPVGEFTRTYKYTHTTEFQSFEIQCDVNIAVTGDYCGTTAYDPATHICCCGKPHMKKSGYKCCGTNYYNPGSLICCQDTSLVVVGGHCPF